MFTLAVAATLAEDPVLLRGFLRRIVGRETYAKIRPGARFGVRTQVLHKTPRCFFDMIIEIDDRPFLVLEHKLWSPEGDLQVDKYLSLPKRVVPRVAFISGYYANSISGSESKRYLRHPSSRLHFVWSDFYDLFAGVGRSAASNGSGLRRATKALFDKNLFQPTHWSVAGLRDADPVTRAKADGEVEKITLPARRGLERLPFGYTTDSSWTTKSEFYATDGRSRRLAEVRLAPGVIPGALKLVLKCTSKAKAMDVKERVERAMSSSVLRSSIIEYRHLGYSGRRNPHAIQILTPWTTLFSRYTAKKDRPLMANALKRYVLGVVASAS